MERSEAAYIELQSDFVILAREQDSAFHENVENILRIIRSKTLEVRLENLMAPAVEIVSGLTLAATLLHTRATPDDGRFQHPPLLTNENQHHRADHCDRRCDHHIYGASQHFDSIEHLSPTAARLDNCIGDPVPFGHTSILSASAS